MNPSITVIVPVGRVDDALAQQLIALIAQDIETSVEFVIAQNTTDRAAATELALLVDSLDDSRVRVVVAGDRRGAAYARNVGASNARGAVLAFCDGDDLVEPTWLGQLVGGLDHYDAVGGRLIDSGLTDRQRSVRPPATPDALPTFLGVPYIVSASMAIGRETFTAVGGFDENLVRCEDIAFSWALLDQGFQLGFVSEARVAYFHRADMVGMLIQHFHYGRGMSQVLMRYGVPEGSGRARPTYRGLLRANGQSVGRRSLLSTLRRVALAAGRLTEIANELPHRRRWAAS